MSHALRRTSLALFASGLSACTSAPPTSADGVGDAGDANDPGDASDAQLVADTRAADTKPSEVSGDTGPAKGDAVGEADTAPALPAPIAGKPYALVFDDEFTTLATISKGNVYDGAKWYNGVDQCCMSDSTGLPAVMYPTEYNKLVVDPYSLRPGGGLNITLSKQGGAWYSGVMTSVDSKGVGFQQQYGYFEIRAQLPAGDGTWPAFWLLSTAGLAGGSSGEIDVFEQYGQFPDEFCTTLHDWNAKTTPFYKCGIKVANMETGFHTWGMLWTAASMTVYFDDVAVVTTDTPPVMQQPYYMLVDLGLGGGWPTTTTPSPSVMQVDYVRVYAPK